MSTEEKTDINEILKATVSDGTISCAEAFKLVKEHSIFPNILGIAIDNSKIRMVECQLGLFGHGTKKIKDAESVSEKLEDKIFEYLEDGKISCLAIWNISSELKMSRFEVACACEKLKIKIIKCQLGAF
ncbi:MAG TPA: hypothetical protein PK358_06495 [Spirochaetota bacterium]|nr:hypothetical protein [Spirochaetota bacterium]